MIFRYCDEGSVSLCICADSPEPSLPAHDILVLIILSSDYMDHESLCKCADSQEYVFATGVNSTQIAI